MEEITFHVQLVAREYELGGYILYVFKNLDCHSWDFEYIMCTQFPNWNQKEIEVLAKGYVSVRYVKEGISQWYDGEKMNAYKNTNVVFLKFVKEPEKLDQEFVID